jgi:hypothetical protein
MSAPTAPSGNSLRNRSIIGHGWSILVMCARGRPDDAHLVACSREMRGYLLVDGMHMFFFVGCALILLVGHFSRDATDGDGEQRSKEN